MIDLTAESVLLLPFVLLADRKNLPHESGIYFVVDSSGSILYVGKGVNLAKRWNKNGHQKLQDLLQFEGVKIHWLSVLESESLQRLEASLIRRFNPPLNVMKPDPRKFVPGGTALMARRKELSLRTVDVASRLGVAESTVRAWENGRSTPVLTPAEWKVFLGIYQVTLDELLGILAETRRQLSVAA